ncbi:MAG TPA: MATE family efflux transporter [Bacteroidales bacterium]|nr:MATE family efflux transporter [Bacteroidales bacterium]
MKDLTVGHEGKLIWQFSVPMIIGNVFQQLYQIIDSVVVGHFIGKEALAAIGASFPIIFVIVSLAIGVSMGGTVLVAQFFGAKDFQRLKRTVDTINVLLFFLSMVLSTLGIIFSAQIFRMMHLPEPLIPIATSFLNVYLSGTFIFFGFNAISAILRGMGDSKTPLYFLIISTIINTLLDLLFVGIFKWGVASTAVATIISQSVAFIAAIIYLNKTHKLLKFSIRNIEWDRLIFSKIMRIGLPTGIQNTFVALAMMALMVIVNQYGTDVIAAYSVGYRIEMFASMPAMNFAMALSAFVGQNIGAGKMERVKTGLLATLKMSVCVALCISVLVFFAGDLLINMFTTDANVIRYGHEYLRIAGSFYAVFTAMFIFGGVMRGAGDTFIPMLVTLFSLWFVRLPLASFLSGKYAEKGIWWSIPIAWFIGAIFSYFYYRTGRWKKKSFV